MDCERLGQDAGCNGGLQSNAFKYLESNKQNLESDYPYVNLDFLRYCHTDMPKGVVGVKNYTNVPAGSVSQLKAAIDKQPVSITLDANSDVFQSYSSGILDSPKCGTELDHAVMAVGYGTEDGKDFYIVRNSWGTQWGDKGYIKIAAVDGKGICGIQQVSLYPETD